MTNQKHTCSLCGFPTMVEGDELSFEIGGHCSGCMTQCEADLGDEASKLQLQEEIAMGWRDASGKRIPLELRVRSDRD